MLLFRSSNGDDVVAHDPVDVRAETPRRASAVRTAAATDLAVALGIAVVALLVATDAGSLVFVWVVDFLKGR